MSRDNYFNIHKDSVEAIVKKRKRFRDKNQAPSGYKLEKHILPPLPLEETETNLLLSICANTPGVTYTPRNRTETKDNGITPHRWEVLGFKTAFEYYTWLDFNGRREPFNDNDASMEANELLTLIGFK